MKVINFGSLNIDKVYGVHDFVRPGETVVAQSLHLFAGGKGLNQSIAIARAGAECLHAGAIGCDGAFLEDLLRNAGVDVSHIMHTQSDTGHAIIQVTDKGENGIIVYAGANNLLDRNYVDSILSLGSKGDIVLLQNETSMTDYIISKSRTMGYYIVFNPSPFPVSPENLPLTSVDLFMVNEIEAALLAGVDQGTDFDKILSILVNRYQSRMIVMTVGAKGVLCAQGKKRWSEIAFPAEGVDTTAAGDTFCGYFLASLLKGFGMEKCLEYASLASAIAISRPGAAPSIPMFAEVEASRMKNGRCG